DPKPKVVWTGIGSHDAFTPPVVWGACIYGFYIDDRKSAGEVAARPGEMDYSLRCTDLKTGKLLWKEPGFHMGVSISAADGLVFAHDYQRVTLVEANPTAYVQKGRVEKLHNVPNVGKKMQRGLLDWSMPVIAGGRMYIRTPVEIICL